MVSVFPNLSGAISLAYEMEGFESRWDLALPKADRLLSIGASGPNVIRAAC